MNIPEKWFLPLNNCNYEELKLINNYYKIISPYTYKFLTTSDTLFPFHPDGSCYYEGIDSSFIANSSFIASYYGATMITKEQFFTLILNKYHYECWI